MERLNFKFYILRKGVRSTMVKWCTLDEGYVFKEDHR